MIRRLSRPIAVLAMASALLAATPLAAGATAPPTAGPEPTASCSTAPPPLGFSFQGTYQSCGECLFAAFDLEQDGRSAYCYIDIGAGRVHLYASPIRP